MKAAVTADVFDNVLVVPLRAAPEAGLALAGAKATTLGRLAGAGFAVPEGLVLTTRATMLAASPGGEGCAPSPAGAAPFPDAVETAVAAIAAHFGEINLAVRSSSTEEDLPGASFAGQYDTVLGVRGIDGLRAAVRRCLASAQGDRVRSYTAGRPTAPIAVLVQRQVAPEVAGVAFSANPVTGATDEVVVSAVPGLAADLVGGGVSPDEWLVKGSRATVVRAASQALAEPQVQAVAALARQVAGVLGGPQDIEWAMAGGRLLILQARPVTALPVPPAVDLPPGTWFKDVERYPEPFTVFGASVAEPIVAAGLTSMFQEFGAALERMEVRIVGGEAYTRTVPLGGHQGTPPPWWVLGLLARLTPSLRRRMRAARTMVRPEVFETLMADWESQQRSRLAKEAARMRAADLSALGARELEAHLSQAVGLLRRGLHVHFRLIPLYTVALHELAGVCHDLLGWSESQALELVAGTSAASSAPTRALTDLAARIAENPAARDAVAGAGRHMADRLAHVNPELAADFTGWCDRYAYRCIRDDPGSPVWMERPWLLGKLLEDLVEQHASGRPTAQARVESARRHTVERACTLLAGASAKDRDRFERLLSAATRYYPLREDTAFWGASIPAGVVRLALVEAGRRLCANGSLDQPGDAAHIDCRTLSAALLGDPPCDLRARVKKAQAERAWAGQHSGPPRYGPAPSGAMPDLRGLPKPARRLNMALIWGQTRPPAPAGPQSADDAATSQTLTGAAASPGDYTGPARVVRGEDDFTLVRPGDVLVCATTDPAWSVLFGLAGALVTDHGGILAHAAIVAREHGIPAVVGTGNATRVINNGDIITVAGTHGLVTRGSKP